MKASGCKECRVTFDTERGLLRSPGLMIGHIVIVLGPFGKVENENGIESISGIEPTAIFPLFEYARSVAPERHETYWRALAWTRAATTSTAGYSPHQPVRAEVCGAVRGQTGSGILRA